MNCTVLNSLQVQIQIRRLPELLCRFHCPRGHVFIGTWKDDIRMDQKAVKAYIGGEIKPNAGAHSGKDWGKFDIEKEVIGLCPTGCMWMEGGKLMIDNKECNRCMHCINVMPQACGRAKIPVCPSSWAPSAHSGRRADVLLTVPFMKAEPPYDNIRRRS